MENSKDTLGDRMKGYELLSSNLAKIPSGIPVLVRIDGKAFHTWVRGLDQPYDLELTKFMEQTTQELVQFTGAKFGYTQSDEITLLFIPDQAGSTAEIYFNGKVQKLASVCASAATRFFAKAFMQTIYGTHLDLSKRDLWRKHILSKGFPVFDARVFGVPDLHEATNAIYWRVRDAVKNSISTIAMNKLGKKAVETLNQNQRLEACAEEWDALPEGLKAGILVFRHRISAYKDEKTSHGIASIPIYPGVFFHGTHAQRLKIIEGYNETLQSGWVG